MQAVFCKMNDACLRAEVRKAKEKQKEHQEKEYAELDMSE
jgi:hypothetical protein